MENRKQSNVSARNGHDVGGGQELSHEPMIYYLAYGSNLCKERLATRCPDAVPVGVTRIRGYRLLFKRSGSGFYATIEQDANRYVPTAVYMISEADEALLDRYEGCPKYYYKRWFRRPIWTLDGVKLEGFRACMAYILHEDRQIGEPGMEYYKLLDDGYKTWGKALGDEWGENWGFDVKNLERGLSASIGSKAAAEYLERFRKL